MMKTVYYNNIFTFLNRNSDYIVEYLEECSLTTIKSKHYLTLSKVSKNEYKVIIRNNRKMLGVALWIYCNNSVTYNINEHQEAYNILQGLVRTKRIIESLNILDI